MSGTERVGSHPTPSAYCLNLHAGYQCLHSGACCTAGWPIHVERPLYETLRVHFGADRRLFDTSGPLPDGAAAVVALAPTGECVFFERDRGRLCAVHRELGPARLPEACRHFPRVALRDGRGLLISLSHFCPTAARLLVNPDPPAIVRAPSTLTLDDGVEGLDARHALPPLLRPGMLTDVEGYATWEARALQALAREEVSASRALATIEAATRRVQGWRPGGASLSETVNREFDVASADDRDEDLDADRARARLVLASMPVGIRKPDASRFDEAAYRWDQVARWWPDVDPMVRAYLAARLFGNWVAYSGLGLHAIVEYLRVARSILKLEAARHDAGASSSPWQIVAEATRHADLLLLHLSDPKDLARRLS
jgi:Fe-S-cluster containining protein